MPSRAERSAASSTRRARRGAALAAAPCDQRHGFVCEREPWTVDPRTNHAYRIDPRPLTFDEATCVCAAAGAHLASIADDDEHHLVATRVRGEAWLAGRNDGSHAPFGWLTGEPFRYQRFAVGDPDGNTIEPNCIAIDVDDAWHDRPCSWPRYAALCERD